METATTYAAERLEQSLPITTDAFVLGQPGHLSALLISILDDQALDIWKGNVKA